ncbi:MAG: binding-protein-dependent transport system inner rane component [Nevskia sp.]|nr:binding-protein-dependent transport system inner rane component [Nevskia sp.]
MRTKQIGAAEMAPTRGGGGGGQQGDAPVAALLALLRRVRVEWKWLIIGLCVAITLYAAVIPLVFLLWQSFLTPDTADKAAAFTFGNYLDAYGSPETVQLLWNSLRFAFGTAGFSFVVGTALAWMNERTNAPLKSLFFALSLVPLVIPGVLFTVSWIMLGSSKIGLVNLVLQHWFGLNAAPFDVYSMGGMIWVDGLHYSPMAFLLMSAAFRAMDPSLEESAMMCGASVPQVIWRITLRLSWPAVFGTFLILFVRSIESFEVPALLGLPAGINVFTSSIYEAIHRYPSQVGLASSYAMCLLLITSAGTWFVSRLSSSGSKYATMTGKGFRPRRMDLGPWRWPMAGLFIVYFMLILVLPLGVLLWSSFQHYYAVPSMAALHHLTLDPYRAVLNYPNLWRSVWNSIVLSFGTATAIMLVTSVICWIVVKTRFPGRRLLEQLSSLPMVFPGLVLGLSVMIFYLHVDIGVYGTLWILFIAYFTRFMPYGLRFNTTSMLQIHKELEESSAMSGASWFTTFHRIVLPLLKPGLVSGWIYIMIVSIRELSSSILLYSPGNEVISVVVWEFWENGQYVELSALAVMFILLLLTLVMAFQYLAKRFGIKEN